MWYRTSRFREVVQPRAKGVKYYWQKGKESTKGDDFSCMVNWVEYVSPFMQETTVPQLVFKCSSSSVFLAMLDV